MKQAQKSQAEAFKRIARELECDEGEERFNANLKQIAKDGAKTNENTDE